MQNIESKRIMLGNYPELHFLAMPGFCWAKEGGLGAIITVVAVEGAVQDWSAYHQTPWIDSNEASVAANGDKLPQEVAELIFPEWAKKFSWRN
jgi:hypothetical protein